MLRRFCELDGILQNKDCCGLPQYNNQPSWSIEVTSQLNYLEQSALGSSSKFNNKPSLGIYKLIVSNESTCTSFYLFQTMLNGLDLGITLWRWIAMTAYGIFEQAWSLHVRSSRAGWSDFLHWLMAPKMTRREQGHLNLQRRAQKMQFEQSANHLQAWIALKTEVASQLAENVRGSLLQISCQILVASVLSYRGHWLDQHY